MAYTDPQPFLNHELAPFREDTDCVLYERRPAKDRQGNEVPNLYTAWISLNNPKQFNSYTTEMAKQVILGFRRASCERDVVAVVFTAVEDRAFCTGGNTKEYAEYYSGAPEEYQQYMRLFNDMVTAILHCDKPVICRVNGMRVAGGQEIGMACDYTISSDLAVFGQAGPRHGSAPDGGSTDFLPLYVGIERAMQSCTLCEMWTSYEAHRYGLTTQNVAVLEVDGKIIPNPMVITDRWIDDMGQIVHGLPKTGDALKAGKELFKKGKVNFAPLDAAVEGLIAKLLATMPNCTRKTIESVRKHKLVHWDKNRESNRSWLGLNMMTEAVAGFRAFNEGPRHQREVDFVSLRQRLAAGERWSPEFIETLIPREEPVSAGS